MKSLFATLFLAGLLWSCTGKDTLFRATPPPAVVNTWPFSSTLTTALPSNVPAEQQLYLPFQTPFSGSATHRLKQIDVYTDARFFARSVFTYDRAGNLASRSYLADYGFYQINRLASYVYNERQQLIKETTNDLLNKSQFPFTETDYAYANDQPQSSTRRTGVSAERISLNTRTAYAYLTPTLSRRVDIGYYLPLAGTNIPSPVDSTRHWITTTNRTTTTVDSVWYVSGTKPILGNVKVSQLEQDARGNAVSIPLVSWDNTVTTYQFVHQYDGPGGLLSRSFCPTYGLRYEFTYEPK